MEILNRIFDFGSILLRNQSNPVKVEIKRPPPGLYRKDNFNCSKIKSSSIRVLGLYKFPRDFIDYCSIFIRITNEKVFIFVKFPIDSSREKGKTFYFRDHINFMINDAMKLDEILHNRDTNSRGNLVEYSEFNINENKVTFEKFPSDGISLAVLVKNNTYTSNGTKIITEVRGNKEICGLVNRIRASDAFINCPSFIDKEIDIKIKSARKKYNFSRLLESYNCQKMQLCYNYLAANEFNFDYFDNNGNRCYCNKCFPNTWINSQVVGGETYIIPRGWTRFGLKTPIVLNQQNDIWNSWCNVFHGTSLSGAKSIIEHKTLLINKDITLEGKRLGKNSSTKEWNNYYISPHICYASHPWYSKIIPIGKINEKNKYAQIIIACKIRPKTYEKQRETEGGVKKKYDDYSIIPEKEIEWYSNKRGCLVSYGILVRTFGETKLKEIQKRDS